MKTPFSRTYVPPAPVLAVSLASPDESPQVGPTQALIDTGADGTFVPTSFLEILDVPIVYTTNVRSHLGESAYQVAVYKVDLILGEVRLPNVEVVGDDWGSEIILGRNVLNKLRLFLDGPGQMTDLRE